jgi:hypothetical protein
MQPEKFLTLPEEEKKYDELVATGVSPADALKISQSELGSWLIGAVPDLAAPCGEDQMRSIPIISQNQPMDLL